MSLDLFRLYDVARDLIGDSSTDNPEYARGIVELITQYLGLPTESGGDAVAERLGIEWDAIYPRLSTEDNNPATPA